MIHHFQCVPGMKNNLPTSIRSALFWVVRKVPNDAPLEREAKDQQRASNIAPIRAAVRSVTT
jgi:hypothetical protein